MINKQNDRKIFTQHENYERRDKRKYPQEHKYNRIAKKFRIRKQIKSKKQEACVRSSATSDREPNYENSALRGKKRNRNTDMRPDAKLTENNKLSPLIHLRLMIEV